MSAAAACRKNNENEFWYCGGGAVGTGIFLSVECSSHIQCVAVQSKDADGVDEHLRFSHFLLSSTSWMSSHAKHYLAIEKRKVS